MNDFADLTDKLNELLDAYRGDADGTVVDLDAWATLDIIDLYDIVVQTMELRRSEFPGFKRPEYDPVTLEEYYGDDGFDSVA